MGAASGVATKKLAKKHRTRWQLWVVAGWQKNSYKPCLKSGLSKEFYCSTGYKNERNNLPDGYPNLLHYTEEVSKSWEKRMQLLLMQTSSFAVRVRKSRFFQAKCSVPELILTVWDLIFRICRK